MGRANSATSIARPRWSQPSERRAPPTMARYRSRTRATRRRPRSDTRCRCEAPLLLRRAGHRRGTSAHIVAPPKAAEPLAEIVEVNEHHRRRIERQHLTDDQPADDGDAKRMA